jgi:hypothetical protein
MLAEGDPTAVALFKQYKGVQMPNLRLVNSDVDKIIGFLEKETKAAAAADQQQQHQHHHEAAPAEKEHQHGAEAHNH